jgi:hypothetical protein
MVQTLVFVLSGSVALLADLIHNFGDAATALPLGIAFALRSATAERWAGVAVVLAIFVSACVAGYEAIGRLIDPEAVEALMPLAVAGVLGFAGNWWAAIIRTRAGRRLGSAALPGRRRPRASRRLRLARGHRQRRSSRGGLSHRRSPHRTCHLRGDSADHLGVVANGARSRSWALTNRPPHSSSRDSGPPGLSGRSDPPRLEPRPTQQRRAVRQRLKHIYVSEARRNRLRRRGRRSVLRAVVVMLAALVVALFGIDLSALW